MDTANATYTLCHSLLHGLHPERESIDRVSELGFSVPLRAIAAAPTDRRTFLKAATIPCLAACAATYLHSSPAVALGKPSPADDDARFRVEARFYEKLQGKNIRCKLCPRGCMVGDRQRGHCRVRENREGTYYSLVHSRVCAAHIDPIEKKPFFHFHPGILAFSVATAGCNVNCKFCQNGKSRRPCPRLCRPAICRPPTWQHWPNRINVRL